MPSDHEFYELNSLERTQLILLVSQLRDRIALLEHEEQAYLDLISEMATAHREDVWERVTKAYSSGQKNIMETIVEDMKKELEKCRQEKEQ